MKPQLAATGEAMGSDTILSVNNIEVVFNEVILVLRGLNLNVQQGKITALLGTNGAGKSTTLKAITNLLASEDGEVTRGSIQYEGQDITEIGPEALVRKGVFLVMEGRGILQDMTVIENLRLGAYSRPKAKLKEEIEEVFRFFPRLKERTGWQAISPAVSNKCWPLAAR